MCPKCRRPDGLIRRSNGGGATEVAVMAGSPTSVFAPSADRSAATLPLPVAEGHDPVSTRSREGRRRRLWELPNGWQCSVIGTCLRLGDLRRTAVRLGLYVGAETLNDYELHGYFVHDAKIDGRVGRILQKMLESEHEGTVRRFSRCRDVAELGRAWDEAVEKGEVASAYWAAMTHPALDEALETRLFGEVHMVSHLTGASHRGELRALATLTRERDQLSDRLRRSELDRLEAVTSRDAEIGRLVGLLGEAERAATVATTECARLSAQIDGDEIRRLTLSVEEATRRLVAMERDLDEKGRLLSEGTAERRRLQAENRDLLMELARAERALQTIAPETEESADEIRVDLAGRRILYVGGRKSTVSHAKRLVERCNGCLLHHDGGLEQSVAELENTLMGADAVVFPVDCVSHNAINCVKRLCERRAMPFRALRSSGLGSLVDVLGDLAS